MQLQQILRVFAAVCVGYAFALTASAGCAPFPYRNYTVQQSGPGAFESRNGEFTFDLPLKRQMIDYGSFGHECFYAHNIDSIDTDEHFSIEWVVLGAELSDDAFVEYWEGFLPEYLQKNFGDGRYDLIEKRVFVDSIGRTSITFAGSGTNNDGNAGSIVGMVSNYKVRMANVYTILTEVLAESEQSVSSELYEPVRRLSQSIKCSPSTCRPE